MFYNTDLTASQDTLMNINVLMIDGLIECVNVLPFTVLTCWFQFLLTHNRNVKILK